MMKNILIILLLSAGLFACNHSTKKQTTADTSQQVADTGKVKQSILDDSIAKTPATTDTGTTKTVSADRLISAGRGIGRILLNENVENVSQLLGRPDSSDAAMGSLLIVWYAKHNSSGYKTSVFSHRNMGAKDEVISRIQKILITSPEFKTANGVGVGATRDEIKKTYHLKPISDYKNKDGKVQVYTDMDQGISFEMDANNKCVGVGVHKAHDKASAYLNMH